MDEHPRRRTTERKSGSSSRSPSLSRRPSLKDKKAPGTIVKLKGKKSGASGNKKERWLLTRKTWRYMSDAVGNLLPESHRASSSASGSTAVPGSSVGAAGATGGGGRRTSAGATVTDVGASASCSFQGVADIPGVFPSVPTRPKSIPMGFWQAGPAPVPGPSGGSGSGQGSKASSTVTSPTYGGAMSFPSHRPGVTPTGPGPGKLFSPPQSQQQILIATEKFYPPSDDIPTLEKHFDAVCSKEKRFLLWTRTKPKGPSGPTLREMKKQQKEQKSKSGKHTGGGHRDSSGSILEALHMRLGSSSGAAGGSSGAGNKENVLGSEYYSPTTEEEDDYDEYDDDEVTVRERRKSSTASSTMSMMGTGQCWTQGSLTFFRPLSTVSSHGSESSYSMIVSAQGIPRICRNTGTQTDPFPEELLIRFRLQAVEEERQQQQQQQQQCLRQISPDNQSETTTVESPMSPVRLEAMQKVSSPPPTTTASSPMSPTTSTEGGLGRASSGSGRESQEKLLETGSSTRPSISGQSESMATTKSGEGTSTTTTTTTTDKKSEESGYSSSISDTVMKYLRIIRKNSKADNKDTIDKFKTVNYDRSLRYIKSKNVTVEEALAHEKNKQQAAQQQLKQEQGGELKTPQSPGKNGSGAATVSETVTLSAEGAGPSSSSPIEGAAPSFTSPPEKTSEIVSKRKSSLASTKTGGASSEVQSPSSPTSLQFPGFPVQGKLSIVASGAEHEQMVGKRLSLGQILDSDIPPSSPPPPPPTQSPPLSPSALSERRESQGLPNIGARHEAQQEGPASVGIQAGESLVHFLKSLNLNPLARKLSDFSSSCCSSDSPAEVFSPRYSFATTAMSGSASDTEMFGGGVQQAAMASMMAMASARGMRRPHQDQTGASSSIGPSTAMDVEGTQQYEDIFQGMRSSFFPKPSQHLQSGALSSSWSSSATATQTADTAIKKSSSVQQISFSGGDLGGTVPPSTIPITTTSSSTSYSFSHFFHYKSSRGSRDPHTTGGISPGTTSTPVTPTTSSMGGSSGGLMKSFFGSSPFSSTFGLKRSALRKPTSTTSLTITTNTGSDSISGRGNAPPPTTSSSPNLLSLIQSGAASAGTGFSNLFSSRSGGGGSGSSVMNASRGGELQQTVVSSASAASSSGELRAQEASGVPLYPSMYSRSSLPISGVSGKTYTGSVGGHHHHSHHVFVSSGHSGGTTFMAKGLSDLFFSHGSRSSARKGSSAQSVDLNLTPSGVMQKSKSSSSVLPLGYGSSGNVSGVPGASSSTAHLRVSPSSSIGGGAGDSEAVGGAGAVVPTTSANISSGGSRLISKSKLFKSRSKSSTRAATSSTGSAVCTWSPQGRCKWKSVSGKVVTLEPSNVLSLSEVERVTLQEVALDKLRALNLGVDVKIPKEKVGGGQQKPKRRPYLLKKKALSTGFFESGSKREETKESSGGGSGLVFGISLSQCVEHDRLRQIKSAAASAAQPLTTPDWEQQQQQAHAHHKRSQNGSRNSVSSVFEIPKEDKDPLQPPQSSSVPALVTACINHLENYGLHTTGIFRVSTSLKRIRQLREDIDSGKEIQFGEDHSPHDVAALLKEFLRDLPEPLLCRDLYQAFLKTQKIRNRKLQLEAIQHLVQLLPVSNRDTLAALLKFFAKVVANSSETRSKTGEILPGNKMEGYSLATLIAPNILPCMPTEGATATSSASSMDQNAALTKERRESIDLVNYMISNFGAIFDITPELLHDVYLHLMDTNPEAIEGILRQRCGAPDDGIDELETTSSVFEESEGGEALDPEDTLTAAASKKVYRRREDILHEGAGKGGSDEIRTRERTRTRREEQGTSIALAASDAEKQAQSGGESDSSIGARSTSRWFRRSRGDAKGRTSSDSGSEKVKVSSRKRESSLFESKRASSLDSVNIQDPVVTTTVQSMRASPRASAVISGITDLSPSRPLSGSDLSLRVPEHLVNMRRQSSPVLESSGIITASLKIPVPVPLNIDDSDIPYIEDDNSGEGASAHPYHHHHIVPHQQQQPTHHQSGLQYQQQPPPTQKYQQRSPYQYPQVHMQHPDMTSPTTDVTVIRCRSMSTDSTVPLKTTSSSVTTTPISSPARQPSSEVSSPTSFSPPTSPPLYGTFPIEEMTARMLIGSAAASSSTQSPLTALSTSPSMHQFHHHGAITMTTPSSTGHHYPTMSTITTATVSKEQYKETRSASSTPVSRPKIEKSSAGVSSSLGASSSATAPVSRTSACPPTHFIQPPLITASSQGAIASLGIPTPKTMETGAKSAPPSPQLPCSTPTNVPSSSSSTSILSISYGQPVEGVTQQQQSSAPSSVTMMLPAVEPKGLGKETKGANIAGLIKSKTADFDKIGPTKSSTSLTEVGESSSSSVSSSGVGQTTAPSASSYSGGHHQIYSIAPKMRLRSQENVLLKQQFLLRQQQQHQQGETNTTRRERSSQKGPSDLSTDDPKDEGSSHGPTGGRPLSRRRLIGSASSSAIVSTKGATGTSTTTSSGTVTSSSQRLRSRDSESGSIPIPSTSSLLPPTLSSSNVPGQAVSSSQGAEASVTSSGSSPSRWKRSEIIASRQQSQPPSDPETFV